MKTAGFRFILMVVSPWLLSRTPGGTTQPV